MLHGNEVRESREHTIDWQRQLLINLINIINTIISYDDLINVPD